MRSRISWHAIRLGVLIFSVQRFSCFILNWNSDSLVHNILLSGFDILLYGRISPYSFYSWEMVRWLSGWLWKTVWCQYRTTIFLLLSLFFFCFQFAPKSKPYYVACKPIIIKVYSLWKFKMCFIQETMCFAFLQVVFFMIRVLYWEAHYQFRRKL